MTYTINSGYISVPISIDPTEIETNALQAIATTLPGWVPRDSHIEVLLLEQFAAMASESAIVASSVPQSIFSYLGTLFGINPIQGAKATVTTVWTMIDNKGYTIPAGTVVGFQVLGNQTYQFNTVTAFTVPTGQTSSNYANPTGIIIQAQEIGTVFNNLAAQTLVQITSLSYVASIASLVPTAGGVDAETTADYLNRLSDVLQLITPRPILPADFALLAQQVAGVYRAAAFNGVNPFGNVLSVLDGTFDASIGSWTGTNCTLSEYTSGTFPNAMKILGSGSGNAQATTTFNTYTSPPPYGYAVASNQSYVATVSLDLASTGEQVQLQANCFDVNGNSTGIFTTSSNSLVVDSTTATTGLILEFTTPAETFTATLEVIVNAIVSTAHYPYLAALYQGAAPTNLIPDSSMTQITGVGSLPWSWTITSSPLWSPEVYSTNVFAMHATGNGGAQAYTASSQRTHLPAGTYTISAFVDATHVTGGTPTIVINEDSGPVTVTWDTIISPGNAVTAIGTFTLGSDQMISMVFSTAGCVTAPGQFLTFVYPQILSGDLHLALPAYTAGPTYNVPGEIYNQERTVTVAGVDVNGNALSAGITASLSAYLQAQREVNFIVNVIGPTYTSIDVKWSGVCDASYNPSTVTAAVKAALQAYLSPATWAGGANVPPYWDASQTSVWYLSIVGLIDDVPGISHLESVSIGFTVPSGVPTLVTQDLTLPGYAPLPLAGNITGTLSTS